MEPHLPAVHIPDGYKSVVPDALAARFPFDMRRSVQLFQLMLGAHIAECESCKRSTTDGLALEPSAVVLAITSAKMIDPEVEYPGIDPLMEAALTFDRNDAVSMMHAVDIVDRMAWAAIAVEAIIDNRRNLHERLNRDDGLVWRKGKPVYVPRPRQRQRTGRR